MQKIRHEEWDRRRQLSTELKVLRPLAQRVLFIESQLQEKGALANSLSAQQSEAMSPRARLQGQLLELATTNGKIGMQLPLVDELRTFLNLKNLKEMELSIPKNLSLYSPLNSADNPFSLR